MKRKPKYLKESPADRQLRMVLICLIGSIFLCVSCLVGTTWALFQTTITIEDNVLTIGKLEVAVALMRGDQAEREVIEPSGEYTYKLNDVGTYSISLINSGSVPGFCTVKLTDNLGNEEAFSTGTLNPAGEGMEDAATIELTVTPEDIYNGILPVTLEITPYWGEDPAYTIADIHEDVFIPTGETTEPTTGDFWGSNADDGQQSAVTPTDDSTAPTATTEATEPTQEATEPDSTTEATEEASEATTDATEATEASTEATEPSNQSRSLEPVETTEATEGADTEVTE